MTAAAARARPSKRRPKRHGLKRGRQGRCSRRFRTIQGARPTPFQGGSPIAEKRRDAVPGTPAAAVPPRADRRSTAAWSLLLPPPPPPPTGPWHARGQRRAARSSGSASEPVGSDPTDRIRGRFFAVIRRCFRRGLARLMPSRTSQTMSQGVGAALLAGPGSPAPRRCPPMWKKPWPPRSDPKRRPKETPIRSIPARRRTATRSANLSGDQAGERELKRARSPPLPRSQELVKSPDPLARRRPATRK